MFCLPLKVQLDRGDWGSDLPSVETHLENHRSVHRAIEEFQMSLKEAKLSEVCTSNSPPILQSFCLDKLINISVHHIQLFCFECKPLNAAKFLNVN